MNKGLEESEIFVRQDQWKLVKIENWLKESNYSVIIKSVVSPEITGVLYPV